MNRRTFLRTTTAMSGLAALSGLHGVARVARGQHKEFYPRPGTWRTYELTTRVEVLKPRGLTQVWIPVPALDADYQKPGDSRWSGNARTTQLVTEAQYGAVMLYAEFPETEK